MLCTVVHVQCVVKFLALLSSITLILLGSATVIMLIFGFRKSNLFEVTRHSCPFVVLMYPFDKVIKCSALFL